ncbi:DUF4169 family protein [Henriciella mobilis]|uniref:DUF4169 family protein n=1 Tax=Henriciella mobilis TaxID=2305467 RepID=A0A399RNZ4_9PROT|nr:DUF4169 family protein [Henriciella mobilis]RIJ16120.1 DUF4169 family protein [Henriciella mobilis]RIJ22968.1 DUF4169 family protein [Henriciella mobilis]RIJ32511.1 DUF4169 family protein [Henriciella mobilis]
MSDQPINLNKARKAKAKARKEQQAVENRAKFGRTKAERQAETARLEKLRKEIDAAKRET